MFIDINGKVFKINLPETGDYSETTSRLNTSGIFETLGLSTDEGFDRYSNAYQSSKYIVDTVNSIVPVSN